MSKVDVVEILKKSDALLEGHFLLSSGKHSNRYVQCAKVLRFPQYAEQVLSTVVEQIKDLDEEIDINENGKNALENAYIKAKTYYDKTKIPTIGMDDCLFIEGISEEEQPGTNVRRVNGKRLNDEEMIEYYTKLVKKYGNKLTAKWVYGMVVCTDKGIFKFTWSKDDFYLVDKPIEKRNVGYPLDSISVIPETGKYFAELVEQKDEKYKKKESIEKVINFIVKSLNS